MSTIQIYTLIISIPFALILGFAIGSILSDYSNTSINPINTK